MSWNHLSSTIRASIVKTVVRLCLMRASRKETLLKSHVIAAVGAMDLAYKKLAGCAIKEAAVALLETFGYILIAGDHFLVNGGAEKSRKDEFFLINELEYAHFFCCEYSYTHLLGTPDFTRYSPLSVVTRILPSLVFVSWF